MASMRAAAREGATSNGAPRFLLFSPAFVGRCWTTVRGVGELRADSAFAGLAIRGDVGELVGSQVVRPPPRGFEGSAV